jgi:3-carboxy-cis,cis-muconate cycloisomerase
MAARTLTQYAVPSTFGLKAVSWLDGLASATTRLRTARSAMAVQVGGAAGTLSALAALAGPDRSPLAIGEALADRLGLLPARPWHTDRGTLTTLADALVAHGDAWGRIAGDVALLSRPEIAEVAEEVGGGSSTMPNKANPVLSILVRRHAMWAPHIGALLHSAAGMYVDERPDGAWHVEWDALRLLGRRTVVAASQAADLLGGLRVDAERMAARAREASSDLLAEQRSVSSLLPAGADGSYLGVSGELVDQGLMRAADVWEELR